LEQAACIIREAFNANDEKISKEVAIKITGAEPEKMMAADVNWYARNHWTIENKTTTSATPYTGKTTTRPTRETGTQG
jgi:hypothetical protein